MKIYACHLLNDYSGSPKVLMQLVNGWVKKNYAVTLLIGGGRDGFLSNLPGVTYSPYPYRWASNPWVRLLNLIVSQWVLFRTLYQTARREDIIYVNTVLPFGAALAGKLKGIRVIYHVHETTLQPRLLKKMLFGIMQWTAQDVVFVSEYLAAEEGGRHPRTHILYNALESSFLLEALRSTWHQRIQGHVLMVCSLKWYKGTDAFLQLASRHPHYQFRLVVNASQAEVDHYLTGKPVTGNLQVFPVTTNLHPFFQWADVICNLSRPDGWVETFGLTILEGMAYGLPAIVPPVGGITELVDHGLNGYHADSRDLPAVSDALAHILAPAAYPVMRAHALKKLEQFKELPFLEGSVKILGCFPDGRPLHHVENSRRITL